MEEEEFGVGYPIKKRLAIGQLVKPTSRARLTEERIDILEGGDIAKLQQIVADYRAKEADALERQSKEMAAIKMRRVGRKGGANRAQGANNQAVTKWHDLAVAAEHVLAKLTGV